MAQGIYVDYKRIPSKKALKQALTDGKHISLEAVSIFGNEYDGDIKSAPDGNYFVVIPSPSERKTFAQIVKRGTSIKIS